MPLLLTLVSLSGSCISAMVGFFSAPFWWYQEVNSCTTARRIFTATFEGIEILSMWDNRCTLSVRMHKPLAN
jgi:hypothetical protein